MFLAQILISVVDEYFSCALKFRTFGNMSHKLWPNIQFVPQIGQSGQLKKITFQALKTFHFDQ